MSITKRRIEEQEQKESVALSIAIKAGVIDECEIHRGTYYDGGQDIEEAYKLGNSMFTRGEVSGDFDSRREMTDFIKEVVSDNNGVDACQSCAKNYDED